MNFIDTFPIILVLVGVTVNIVFGFLFKTNFTALMIKSVILTIGLSACGIYISEILKNNQIEIEKKRKIKNRTSIFEAQIPSITHEELNKMDYKEDEFQEMNPAALYKKNSEIVK
ncbi:MAG: hypothetical protein PHC44_02245 [Lutispora sp.]|nr:hypothetical protein [Lutispora sp.]